MTSWAVKTEFDDALWDEMSSECMSLHCIAMLILQAMSYGLLYYVLVVNGLISLGSHMDLCFEFDGYS